MAEPTFTGSVEMDSIGFQTASFHAWPLDKSLKVIAETGYKSVELCLEHPDMSPEKLTADELSRINSVLGEIDLRVSSISYRSETDDIDTALQLQKRGVEIARAFDCKIFAMEMMQEAVDPGGNLASRALVDLLQFAEENGVIVAVEPAPDTVLNGLYEFSQFASRAAGLPLGLNLNVGHVFLTEGDVVAVIHEWAPFIVYTHVGDIRRDDHTHLLPGDGHLNLKELVIALRENNYQGDLTLEISNSTESPDRLAELAIERCREIFV